MKESPKEKERQTKHENKEDARKKKRDKCRIDEGRDTEV